MDPQLPACFGKQPPYDSRAVSCGSCRRFDDCAIETLTRVAKVNGLVKRVGHVASAAESRHHAEIKLYEFTETSK